MSNNPIVATHDPAPSQNGAAMVAIATRQGCDLMLRNDDHVLAAR